MSDIIHDEDTVLYAFVDDFLHFRISVAIRTYDSCVRVEVYFLDFHGRILGVYDFSDVVRIGEEFIDAVFPLFVIVGDEENFVPPISVFVGGEVFLNFVHHVGGLR